MKTALQISAAFWLTVLLLGLSAIPARATIPTAALNDPLFGLGYLVVTDYPNVTNNGTGDCTTGIQAAINDAYANNKRFQQDQEKAASTNISIPVRPLAVFFPPGTYQISDMLMCYEWCNSAGATTLGFNVLVGSTAGTNRPKIILANGAANFQNPASPREMITYRCFQGGSGAPTNYTGSMGTPSGYTDGFASDFWCELRNIDFDCNSNVGAIGVVFTGAQWCSLENVKVSATNAVAGFYMLPGAGSCSANLEVAGGQYGIVHGSYPALKMNIAASTAGPTICGLTLENQTVAAMQVFDEISPITVVGFNFSNTKMVRNTNYYSTSDGVISLMDGQIGISGGSNLVAFDNTAGKDYYLRNVYVTGTTNLVKSGATMTTGGTGIWNYIPEYSYNNPTTVSGVPPNSNYGSGTPTMESESLINGVAQNSSVLFPALSIVSNSAAPPANLISEHLWASFPSFNGDTNLQPTVVVSTNAGYANTDDATALLQAAIDLAHTNGTYNGRVFLPGGIYYTTNTLTIYTNTVLMGAGRQISLIQASQYWKPSGPVTMMQTQNDPNATTTLAYLSVSTRAINNPSDTNYSWFNALTWQAGGNSLVLGAQAVQPYTSNNVSQPRAVVIYTNNGGGQWYTMAIDGEYGDKNNGTQLVDIIGTTQPLWFYGFNLEHGQNQEDCAVINASNVRLLGMKREGPTTLLMITNSTNIAAYGFGYAVTNGTYFKVVGTSTNILLGNITLYIGAANTTTYTVYEAITGQNATNVEWPNAVSLYKRGTIDDSLMYPSTTPPPATPGGLAAVQDSVYPSMQLDITWNSVTNATGYSLERSTVSGGPYSFLTTTVSTNFSDATVVPGTEYYYVVAAYNSGGDSAYSTEAPATTRTNAAPTINPIANLSTNINAPLQTITLTGITPGANETGAQTNAITASSSNTNLVPNPTVSYTNPNTTATLMFTPITNVTGSATITVTVMDNGGTAGGGVNTTSQSFLVTITNSSGGPSAGDYRSVATGNWSTISIWQTYNGSAWVTPSSPPNSSSGVITITNIVTLITGVTADQVVIAAGGQLNVDAGVTFTVADGPGTDLDVFGTVQNLGTIAFSNSPSVVFESGGQYKHNQNGGTIPTATWNASSTCLIEGLTTATNVGGLSQSFGNFSWFNPNSGTYNPASRFDALGALTNIQGDFSVTAVVQTNRLLSYNSTHPAAANHEFAFSLANGGSLHIGGNLNMTNVALSFAGSSTVQGSNVQVYLGGNVNLSGTNTCIYSSYAATNHQRFGSINYTNTVSGTKITLDTAASLYTIYDNSSVYTHALFAGVTLDLTNSGSSIWNFTNYPGSTLKVATTGSTVANIGSLEALDDDGSIQAASPQNNSFPAQETNHFEPNSTYVYDGSAAQNTGSGLPSVVANLVINNAAGVTIQTVNEDTPPLTPAVLTAVTNMLTVTSGSLNLFSTNTPGTVLVAGLAGFGSLTNGSILLSNTGVGLIPGGFNVAGTLTFDGTLTFGTSSKSTFDLTSSATSGNDQVVFIRSGTVAGNNSTVTINPLSTLAENDYVLFNVTGSGTVSSNFNSTPAWTTAPTNAASYSIITVSKQVLLHYSSTPGPTTGSTGQIPLGLTVSGSSLIFTGAGGTPKATYRLLTSTNLNNWIPVVTDIFCNDGSFSNSILTDPSDPARFYQISSP